MKGQKIFFLWFPMYRAYVNFEVSNLGVCDTLSFLEVVREFVVYLIV